MPHSPGRRALLAALAGCCGPSIPARGATAAPAARTIRSADPGHRLQFPRDHGSHPDFRIEWWYVTGWLLDAESRELGFQVTFFRAKPALRPGNPSLFNPEHVIIAHAALADPALGHLVHSQRAARAVFGLAGADTATTRVWLDDWQLLRLDNAYHARISEATLAIDLRFTLTQPLLAHGFNGYSRKGPRPDAASHYYSAPQLQVAGSVRNGRTTHKVSGKAWLDHEWSSSYLPEHAAGWDWIGINLDDGGALMAFRMRERGGGRALWAAATLRSATGLVRGFGADAVRFTALREWQSPRTGRRYPVAFRIEVPGLEIRIEPLMDDQENDTRATTGAVYWEGAVRAFRNGQRAGAGYLELTGYGQDLVL
jgi:predicted secreted hydrolase